MSDSTCPSISVSRWQLAPDADLRVHCWEDECVIWHGAAGDTHRMPEAIGQLLGCLQQGPASVPELSSAIDLHADDVGAGLHALTHLGLVQELP